MKNQNLAVFVLLLLTTSLLLAQTSTQKPRAQVVPNTKAPTKVTGDGVTTPSGLRYWDIKVGTGLVAKDGDHIKVHYTVAHFRKEVRQFGRRASAFLTHPRQGRGHQGMG